MSSQSTEVGTAPSTAASAHSSKSGNDDKTDKFAWLREDFTGPEYISYSELSKAAHCAFDFGQGGYAASTNDGGELLQMAAPSGKHGIVFAWGDFEFSPDLALARGQREQGGKSSFGLKFLGSEGGQSRRYQWSVIERGSFQYRWPIKRFRYGPVSRSHPGAEEGLGVQRGTGSLTSFIDNGCLYQMLRLDPDPECTDKNFELKLTIEGTMQFHSFANLGEKEVYAGQEECRTHMGSPGTCCVVAAEHLRTNDHVSEIHWQGSLWKLDTLGVTWKPVALEQSTGGASDGLKEFHAARDDEHHGVPKWVTKNKVEEAEPRKETNAVEEAEPRGKTNPPHVFLAMFRLLEAKQKTENCPEPPSPDKITNLVLAKSPESPAGTAELWQSLFAERQLEAESVSELCEADMVGRCLEKVLGVDLVPAMTTAQKPMDGRDAKMQAIVSNMFLRASVDMKGLFWKTRFLAKVDKVLSSVLHRGTQFEEGNEVAKRLPTAKEKDLYDGDDSMLKAVQETINRVRRALFSIVNFMVRGIIQSTETRLAIPPHDDSQNRIENCCYPLITVWYIVDAYPDTEWPWRHEVAMADRWDRNHSVLGKRLQHSVDFPLPRSRQTAMEVKKALLCHLHHRSMLALGQKGLLPAVWSCGESEVGRLEKAARAALVKRISSARQYEAGDEVAERLVFLAHELWGSEDGKGHDATVTCLARILKRVEDREHTSTINISDSDPDKDEAWAGPWEVHVLCHHSRLMVAHHRISASNDRNRSKEARADEQEHLEHFKRRLCDFLTSDASLTPCWERNNSSAQRGMMRSEATAIVSSTILDMFLHDYTTYLKKGSRDTKTPENPTPSQCCLHGINARTVSRPFRNHPRHPRERLDAVHLMTLQLDALEAIEAQGEEKQIDYLKFRPPSRFHPDEFFHSLEDTPDYYDEHAIEERSRDIPRVIREAMNEKSGQPTSDKATAGTTKGAGAEPTDPTSVYCERISHKLLSVFDIKSPLEEKSGTGHNSSPLDESRAGGEPKLGAYRVPRGACEKSITGNLAEPLGESVPLREVVKRLETALGDQTHERLRELLLGPDEDGKEDQKMQVMVEALIALAVVDLRMPTWGKRPQTLPPLWGPKILGVISDSLIDQEVRHQILFSCVPYELPKGLLRLLVQVLHPEVVECFKNHHLRLSRFRLIPLEPPIVAHITLRSWSIVPDKKPSFATHEEDKIEIPTDLFSLSLQQQRRKDKNKPLKKKPPLVELRISSVAISTNRFGDFSRCSLITDRIGGDRLQHLGTMAQEICDKFTHQPQTGRFLVFCMILGELCQGLVCDYQSILDEFIRETLLDDKIPIYLKEVQQLQDHNENADVMLRLSLWGLEALFKVNNTLSASVRVLESAIADLKKEMKDGPGRRSPELESVYHEYIGMLERPFRDLTAIQGKLERKVEFNTRYTNALSSVLALRASRTSYQQNNTIQKLTYITLGCLPLSLASAVFAVPKDQNVLNEEMGLAWYVKVIIFFTVGIIAVGACLGRILRGVDRFVTFVTCVIPGWVRGLFKEPPGGDDGGCGGGVHTGNDGHDMSEWLRGMAGSLGKKCKSVVRGPRPDDEKPGDDKV